MLRHLRMLLLSSPDSASAALVIEVTGTSTTSGLDVEFLERIESLEKRLFEI